MKSPITLSVTAVTLTVGLAGLSLAVGVPDAPGSMPGSYTGSPTDPQAVRNVQPGQPVIGTVQKVDTFAKQVELKEDGGKIERVQLDTQSQISRQGGAVNLQDLRSGDVVVIQIPTNPAPTL